MNANVKTESQKNNGKVESTLAVEVKTRPTITLGQAFSNANSKYGRATINGAKPSTTQQTPFQGHVDPSVAYEDYIEFDRSGLDIYRVKVFSEPTNNTVDMSKIRTLWLGDLLSTLEPSANGFLRHLTIMEMENLSDSDKKQINAYLANLVIAPTETAKRTKDKIRETRFKGVTLEKLIEFEKAYIALVNAIFGVSYATQSAAKKASTATTDLSALTKKAKRKNSATPPKVESTPPVNGDPKDNLPEHLKGKKNQESPVESPKPESTEPAKSTESTEKPKEPEKATPPVKPTTGNPQNKSNKKGKSKKGKGK